jgi:hypothetical protein
MQGRRDRMRALDNHLERLSGKYLNGSDRAFLDSAERRKLRYFAPSCGLSWDHETEPVQSFQTVSKETV